MNTEVVKNKLNEHIGKKVTIKYNLGRNKVESYDVVIKELYNKIFLVEEGSNILSDLKNKHKLSTKSSAVLSKNVKQGC